MFRRKSSSGRGRVTPDPDSLSNMICTHLATLSNILSCRCSRSRKNLRRCASIMKTSQVDPQRGKTVSGSLSLRHNSILRADTTTQQAVTEGNKAMDYSLECQKFEVNHRESKLISTMNLNEAIRHKCSAELQRVREVGARHDVLHYSLVYWRFEKTLITSSPFRQQREHALAESCAKISRCETACISNPTYNTWVDRPIIVQTHARPTGRCG